MEIDIMSKLNHQNIVKLYDFFEDDDYIYLVLEYVPCGDLYKLIESSRNHKLDEKTSVKYFE